MLKLWSSEGLDVIWRLCCFWLVIVYSNLFVSDTVAALPDTDIQQYQTTTMTVRWKFPFAPENIHQLCDDKTHNHCN